MRINPNNGLFVKISKIKFIYYWALNKISSAKNKKVMRIKEVHGLEGFFDI